MNSEKLRGLAKWSNLVGWFTIISGIISAVFGLFAFVIGAIPGVVVIIMGVLLVKSSKRTKELFMSTPNEDSLNSMIEYFYKYFKLQGIFMIVYLILFVIGFCLTFTVFMNIP